jgi:conjugative transfer ATPase
MAINQPEHSDASPLTNATIKRHYDRPPSFTDLLPWMEYIPECKAFLLEDGVSLGALFEVTPVGCEARTPAFMAQLRDTIQTAINEAIPERDDAPWVLQVYVQDEPRLNQFDALLAGYPMPAVRASDYSQHYQSVMSAHLQAISRPGGLFDDTTVTGSRWQGQQRRIRVVLYRRLKHNGKTPAAIEVEEALNDVATKWIAALASAGIHVQRADGKAFYHWLLSWFNPKPAFADESPETLLQMAPYPGDDDLPFGYDFAEQLTLSMPRSDEATASWHFDNLPHTVVTIQSLRRAPDIGHFTAERQAGDQVFSLFDRLPEHTIMAITLTLKPQDTTRNHIAQIKRASVGDSAEASITREDAEHVEREMAQGNKLYPVSLAFYVRGENQKSLRHNLNRLNALLLPNGLQPITQEADLLALDAYIRNLPMAYDPHLDKLSRRSRLVFSRHTANLLPVYGRSRGTGHPGPGVLQPGRRAAGLRSTAPGRPQEERPHADPRPDRGRQVGTPGLPAAADGGGLPATPVHHRGRGLVLFARSAFRGERPDAQSGDPEPQCRCQPATVCRCPQAAGERTPAALIVEDPNALADGRRRRRGRGGHRPRHPG